MNHQYEIPPAPIAQEIKNRPIKKTILNILGFVTGRIKIFDDAARSGLVESENGETFSFARIAWKGGTPPRERQAVEFRVHWTYAESVHPLRTAESRQSRLQQAPLKKPQEKTRSEKSPREKAPAVVLALFFGVYGAHKFYLGYIKEGLLHLIAAVVGFILAIETSGPWDTLGMILIFASYILAFIEMIIYLGMSKDAFRKKYVDGRHPWL